MIALLVFAALAALVMLIGKNVWNGYTSGKTPRHICDKCRSVVRPCADRPGSFALELLLWLLLIVPGLIYSIWRLSSNRIISCPVCKALNPIPLNTPAGQALTIP